MLMSGCNKLSTCCCRDYGSVLSMGENSLGDPVYDETIGKVEHELERRLSWGFNMRRTWLQRKICFLFIVDIQP